MTKFNPDRQPVRSKIKKVEEVTDIIDGLKQRYTPENFKAMNIKKGKVLRFNNGGEIVTLRITRVQGNRYWAAHVELVNQMIVRSHYGHNVDASETAMAEYKVPFCTDCQVPVDEASTEDGDVKAADRRDRTLADGTEIPDA